MTPWPRATGEDSPDRRSFRAGGSPPAARPMPGVDPQIIATHPIGDFRDWKVITDWAASIAAKLLEAG